MTDEWLNAEWYHGTNSDNFSEWNCPPPPKPDDPLLYPLKSLFFSTNRDFAKVAGSHIAKVKIIDASNIVNLFSDQEASEKIRKILEKNQWYKNSETIKKSAWHSGWHTGESTRFKTKDPAVEKEILMMAAKLFQKHPDALTPQAALIAIQHNFHRQHIDKICSVAAELGYSGMIAHEGDAHSQKGKVIAQPILAVFKAGIITAPEW